MPAAAAAAWCEVLMRLEVANSESQLAAMQLSRRTQDRYRDLDEGLRQRVVDWLDDAQAPPHLVELVRDGGTLASEERDQVFGEALPKGLRLLS